LKLAHEACITNIVYIEAWSPLSKLAALFAAALRSHARTGTRIDWRLSSKQSCARQRSSSPVARKSSFITYYLVSQPNWSRQGAPRQHRTSVHDSPTGTEVVQWHCQLAKLVYEKNVRLPSRDSWRDEIETLRRLSSLKSPRVRGEHKIDEHSIKDDG
jgi:hypothetical protein